MSQLIKRTLAILCAVAAFAAAAAGPQISSRTVVIRQRFCREIAPASMSQDNSTFCTLHLGYQILGTYVGFQSPVFIYIQCAVLVQILEGKSVIFDDLHTGGGGKAEGLAAFVLNLHPAVI